MRLAVRQWAAVSDHLDTAIIVAGLALFGLSALVPVEWLPAVLIITLLGVVVAARVLLSGAPARPRRALPCPECGRLTRPGRQSCYWCGAQIRTTARPHGPASLRARARRSIQAAASITRPAWANASSNIAERIFRMSRARPGATSAIAAAAASVRRSLRSLTIPPAKRR